MEALRKAGKLATGGDARRAIARGVCTIMITISGMPARRVTALEELTPRRTWAGMEIMRASEMDGTGTRGRPQLSVNFHRGSLDHLMDAIAKRSVPQLSP
jgi:hypothetical protein